MPGIFQNQPQLAGNKVLVTASRNSTQALTIGVSSTVLYNLVSQDPRGNYNPATGTFTASVAGSYRLKASVLFQLTPTAGTTPGSFNLNIFVNGILFFPAMLTINMSPALAYTNTVTAEAVFNLGAGGTCSTQALVTATGGGTAIVVGNGVGTGFIMEYIQPLNA